MHDEIVGGPYLGMAVFCERVLREADGVMSLVRIIDRWNVTGASEAMPLTVLQVNLVITLISGDRRGAAQVMVTPTSPNGVRMPSMTFPVVFEGDNDRGVGVIAGLGFPVQEMGCYWFDVTVDGQPFTRIPVRVVYYKAGPVVQGGLLPPP